MYTACISWVENPLPNLHFSGKGDNPQIPSLTSVHPNWPDFKGDQRKNQPDFIQVIQSLRAPVASLIACTASCQPNESIEYQVSRLQNSFRIVGFSQHSKNCSKLKKIHLKKHTCRHKSTGRFFFSQYLFLPKPSLKGSPLNFNASNISICRI